MTGRSQAVRLPKEFRLEGKVCANTKSDFDWDSWFDMLGDIDIERDQCEQNREGLDDLFA